MLVVDGGREQVEPVRNASESEMRHVQPLTQLKRLPSMSTTTFEKVIEEEVRRLKVIHPTPDDVPGCMRLLDEFLSCHGTSRSLTSLSADF